MTRTLVIAAVLAAVLAAIVAGCDGGGAQDAGPVPGGQGSSPATSSGSNTTGSTSNESGSTGTSEAEADLCSDRAARIKVASRQGAAGTIGTVWRVTNETDSPCHTVGYPGMDFHASDGWLDVQVQRGGLAVIDEAPARVVLDPGESLYFMSFWSDVDTSTGPCKEFDRVKVTLPDNFVPVRLAASGCLDPESVRVGPVSATRPT